MSTLRAEQEAETVLTENLPIISVEVLQTFNVAVARLRYYDPLANEYRFVTGESKRNKGEKFDVRSGRTIAISRALAELAEDLETTVKELNHG
jgi:hypothetical protein